MELAGRALRCGSSALTDTRLGLLLDASYGLGPGASVNTVTLGVSATLTISGTTASASVWQASLPGITASQAEAGAIVNAPRLFLPIIRRQ